MKNFPADSIMDILHNVSRQKGFQTKGLTDKRAKNTDKKATDKKAKKADKRAKIILIKSSIIIT